MVSDSRHYDNLGVSTTATDAQIEKAFKKLSLKYKEVDGEKFQQICEAYEILTDSEKRQFYDEHGQSIVIQVFN